MHQVRWRGRQLERLCRRLEHVPALLFDVFAVGGRHAFVFQAVLIVQIAFPVAIVRIGKDDIEVAPFCFKVIHISHPLVGRLLVAVKMGIQINEIIADQNDDLVIPQDFLPAGLFARSSGFEFEVGGITLRETQFFHIVHGIADHAGVPVGDIVDVDLFESMGTETVHVVEEFEAADRGWRGQTPCLRGVARLLVRRFFSSAGQSLLSMTKRSIA